MAAKVALTAEEFRENSQRSIALFNTEKLSTNSTHVLKSAYAFCAFLPLQSARSVWRQSVPTKHIFLAVVAAICTERVEAKFATIPSPNAARSCNLHGACGGKACWSKHSTSSAELQSARSVWRQRRIANGERNVTPVAICTERVEAKVAGKENFCKENVAICTERVEAK